MGAVLQEEIGPVPLKPDPEVLLAAVEASGEAILITSAVLDGDGPCIEYVNPAFTHMSGYPASEVLGRTPRMFQGPQTDRAMLNRMRAALMSGQPFQGETVNYRKDGSTYFVEWLITPLRDETGTITRWVSAQRDISSRRASEDRQALLVRELHHRVKNTLATVQAVFNATLRSSAGLSEFQRAFSGRIASLAKTHVLITEHHGQVVAFEGMLRNELEAFVEPGRRCVEFRGPHVLLSSELAVPVGMALHELSTNAVRHGALADPAGCLEVTWSVEDAPACPILHWVWNERVGRPMPSQEQDGFGFRMLNRVLTLQIGATVDIDYEPDGLRVTVAIPMPATPTP